MYEDAKRKQAFKRKVQAYFKKHGRHALPWRITTDPYRIAVSEIMLQQTQVGRVIPKYEEFLTSFPTVHDLAAAPLAAVLKVWNGLGYNRRAKFLHQAAKAVVEKSKGLFPNTIEALQTLPGIGHYTARAIAAFAYNAPVVFIETNIRTVYLHHFFSRKRDISDIELLPLIEATLDRKNPRRWYAALMDYGSFLKSQGNVAHRASAHYKKQTAFKGSRRQVRGVIVRALLDQPKTLSALKREMGKTMYELEDVLAQLVSENIVNKNKGKYSLASPR